MRVWGGVNTPELRGESLLMFTPDDTSQDSRHLVLRLFFKSKLSDIDNGLKLEF